MRTDLTGLDFIVVAGETLAVDNIADNLRRRGAKVVVAPDCAAAFEALENDAPDFAILDTNSGNCDAVAAELSSLDIPYIYLGAPVVRDRQAVRDHVSAAFAQAVLALIDDDDSDMSGKTAGA